MTFHKTLEWFGWENALKLAIPTPLVLPLLLLLSVLGVARPSLAGAQCSPGSWVRITAATESCSPKPVQWDLQTSASACRDVPLSCSLPAHPLPLFVPIFPSSASSSPNTRSRPPAFTFPLDTGLFLPLIQLPREPWLPAFDTAGPCSVHLQEILPSLPAVIVEFGTWQKVKSNSPALSQIPTNPTYSMESRVWCCGAGALWCHPGGEDTRTRLCIVCSGELDISMVIPAPNMITS